MTRHKETIWDVVRQASEALPEPFSRAALVAWAARHRPDVLESSLGVHIQAATSNAKNTHSAFAHRTPLLTRVGHGEYRRYRPESDSRTAHRPPTPAPVPARTSAVPAPRSAVAPRSSAVAAPTADVVLVGCSSSKAPSAAPAAGLFTGAAFTKARDLAVRSGKPWYVLSAKFGLLDPEEVVAPYDVYLADQPPGYRSAWGGWVVAQLGARLDLAGAVVEVHAGRAYTDPLQAPLDAVGATLHEPLTGLRQGERLAWYSRLRPSRPATDAPGPADLAYLLDERKALSPDDFLRRGRAAFDRPGLYTWWVDLTGAHALSAGLGERVSEGIVYAGRAGGQRPGGKDSSNTLWGRVGGMHLQGNRSFSTFRLSLTAALRHSGTGVTDEASLTAWMRRHLRVAVLPLPAEAVFPAEEQLLARVDPPMNLQGLPATPLRRTLSRLRSGISAAD